MENRVALISSGARGMGSVEAHIFAAEGSKVVIGDVLVEGGRQTEDAVTKAAIPEIRRAGGEGIINTSPGGRNSAYPRHIGGKRSKQRRGAYFLQVHGGVLRQGKHPLQLGSPWLD